MRYFACRIGKKPKDGYPLYIALHGGGSAPRAVNDRGWEHMKIYYRRSVKNGVYAATRGIVDRWNMHFQAESYVMYDRLIENMIVFGDVDPNRVYLVDLLIVVLDNANVLNSVVGWPPTCFGECEVYLVGRESDLVFQCIQIADA